MPQQRSISSYVASDEFREKMRRVSSKSNPCGNSTPGVRVYEALAEASRARTAKSQ